MKKYDRGMILTGLRGVGKTSLLNHLRGIADHHGWLTVSLEAQNTSSGSIANHRQLANALKSALRRYSHRAKIKQFGESALKMIEGSSLNLGLVSVEAGGPSRDDVIFDIEAIVEEICEALGKKSGKALAIFIDEMQDMEPELLSGLVVAQHRASQENWPFYVFGAGLPNLPAVLADTRSYSERLFDYREIGALRPEEARNALVEPAEKMGGRFTDEALTAMLDAAEGYPYFLQEFGQSIWQCAPASPFTGDDAMVALQEGITKLDQGFYRSRWDRATPAERRYLRAIAQTGYPQPKTSDLSIPQKTAGPLRAELIKKGIVYSPEYGRISFTVPGMAGFIERQSDDDGR